MRLVTFQIGNRPPRAGALKDENSVVELQADSVLSDVCGNGYMAGQLGPGKGKDFDNANAMGPCLVTGDEIKDAYAGPSRIASRTCRARRRQDIGILRNRIVK
jgi:hypothetical protein